MTGSSDSEFFFPQLFLSIFHGGVLLLDDVLAARKSHFTSEIFSDSYLSFILKLLCFFLLFVSLLC